MLKPVSVLLRGSLPSSRSHLGRLLASAVPVALVAALLPGATAHADSRPPLPGLVGIVADGDVVPLERGHEVVIDSGPGRTLAFRGPAGSPLADLRVWLNDGCGINGRTTAWGANGSRLPVTLRSADADVPFDGEVVIPAGIPGEPAGFFIPDPFTCDALGVDPPGRFETLDGTIAFDGMNRRCGTFAADVEISQSKDGDALDTLRLRGSQDNRVISGNPLVTIDDSGAYDDVYLFMGDPDAATGGERFRLEGVAIGGGPGTAPRRSRLERTIERIPPAELTELLRRSIDRAGDSKKVMPLLKALGAASNACTYHLTMELDDGVNHDSVERLWAAARPPLQPLPADPRFEVQVTWADPTLPALTTAELASRSGSAELPFSFFSDDSWETLVKVIDACELNDHFWVFAAARSDVEVTIEVTDTEAGRTRGYQWSGTPADAVTDTAAFATCP